MARPGEEVTAKSELEISTNQTKLEKETEI